MHLVKKKHYALILFFIPHLLGVPLLSDSDVSQGALSPPTPVSMMDRLHQLIKGCELRNLCNSSFTRGGGSGGTGMGRWEVAASHTHVCCRMSVFQLLFLFLPVVSSQRSKLGRGRGISHRVSSKTPVSASVFHFWIEHVQYSSKAGSYSITTNTPINASVHKRKCEPITSAAKLA